MSLETLTTQTQLLRSFEIGLVKLSLPWVKLILIHTKFCQFSVDAICANYLKNRLKQGPLVINFVLRKMK